MEGLNAGADDYITKPFQPEELQVRLRVGERVLSLESRDLTIFALAKLAESRDPDTGAHLERIREYCRIMAEEIVRTPNLSEDVDGDFVHMIYLTSPLHDIGKVGIPDQVLLKPGPLTDEEMEIMKRHTVIGGETLDVLAAAHPEASSCGWRATSPGHTTSITTAAAIRAACRPQHSAVRAHPGSGRRLRRARPPSGCTRKPSATRRPATDLEGRGTHFDPQIVDAFLRREQDFLRLKEALAEPLQLVESHN